MAACVEELRQSCVALAAVVTLAFVNMGAAPALPTMPSRLEQHALMLAAAARGAGAGNAPEQAARYIETALASQGHTVSRRNYAQQGQPMRKIEVTLFNPATVGTAARVLVVGAGYASGTINDAETASVIELARLLKRVRPAEGTELKFVFFVGAAPPDTGNFIAFAGTRGGAELVRKTLASFRAAATYSPEGLAARAYVEGVTLLGIAPRPRHDDPALMITDFAPLHYPYSHTGLSASPAPDYTSMARSVDSLAKLIAGLAAPVSM